MKRGMKDLLLIGLLLMISLFGIFGVATGDASGSREAAVLLEAPVAGPAVPVELSEEERFLEELGADPAATALEAGSFFHDQEK
jgi:hypothetical protein